MTILVTALGLALVGLTLVDAYLTTLAVNAGAGPISSRLTSGLWRLLHWVSRRLHTDALLPFSGVLVVVTGFVVWVLMLWTGWFLVFLGGDAVLESSSREPGGVVDRVYFTAFTIFTLGVGDYVPGTEWAKIATSVATLTGLALVTGAISYLISVVGAVVAKRALAVHVHGLGRSSEEIVCHGWVGDGFGTGLVQHLVALTPQVASLGEQHLAYPVLHYFHAGERGKAAGPALAALDDALTLLHSGVAPQARLESAVTEPLRRCNESLLETVAEVFFHPAGSPPPAPSLDRLRACGIPTVSDEEFHRAVDGSAARRSALLGLTRSDGWDWKPAGDT